MGVDPLLEARQLIGHTLAVHIVIVALSIGLPVILSILEWYAWRKPNTYLRGFIKLVAKWTAVFAIGGIFTGTAVALQLSTLWAPFLNGVRPNVGIFFQLEGYMFLIEAVFLSWYFATMKQVGTAKHFLISIPISVGTIGSAFFITAVNAYMNNPSSMLTSTTTLEVLHSVASYIFATAMVVLGYVAWRSLRAKTKPAREFLNWTIGRLGVMVAVMLVILAILGHQSAVNIATTQPNKLAAIEILDKTQTNAPLRIGGEIDENGVAQGGIVLPGMLSLLAGYDLNTEVKGLNEIPRYQWPLLVVHTLFDLKMALVGISCIVALILVVYQVRKKALPTWARIGLVPLGLIGFAMVELGWLITEFGRQTWAVVGKQATASALTPGANLHQMLWLFLALFAVLSISTFFALYYTTRHWRQTEKFSW